MTLFDSYGEEPQLNIIEENIAHVKRLAKSRKIETLRIQSALFTPLCGIVESLCEQLALVTEQMQVLTRQIDPQIGGFEATFESSEDENPPEEGAEIEPENAAESVGEAVLEEKEPPKEAPKTKKKGRSTNDAPK